MKKRRPMTAAEVLKHRGADPAYQQRRAEQDAAVVRRQAEVDAATRPLLDSLAAIGLPVKRLADLPERYAPLPDPAVRALLGALPEIQNVRAQDLIARALATSAVPFDGKPLAQLFEPADSPDLRWAIANTLSEAKAQGVTDWVLKALADPPSRTISYHDVNSTL
jgi:hypothetical protein